MFFLSSINGVEYKENRNNMFQSPNVQSSSITHHCSFCYGTKAVDEYVAGDVNWWTCGLRDRQHGDTLQKLEELTLLRQN